MATKRVLNRIRLDKIAAVDAPCQEHATVALVKRAPAAGAPPAIVKKTFQEALNAQLVSEKVSDTFWRAFENQWAIKDAFRTALTDEIAEGGDGSDATSGFVQAMEDLASAAANAARNAASTAETDLEAAVEDAVSKFMLQHQEQPMKISTKAQLQKAVADFNPETSPVAHVAIIHKAAADLNAEDELPAAGPLAKAAPAVDPAEFAKVKRDLAIAKMSGDTKTYFEGLDDDAQTAFLAKSADDQAADVAKANAADPVVYTMDDGTEVRKSAGAFAVTMAKRADADAKRIAELEKGQTDTALETRAAAEFGNVAKATAVAMLKSARQLGEDTDAGKDVLKSLKAMNDGSTRLFKSLGSSEAPEVGESIAKARQDFDTEVAKVAREDKIGRADAMSKVRNERPDLFKAAYPESVEEEADA